MPGSGDIRLSVARFCRLTYLFVSFYCTLVLFFPTYLPAEDSVCASVKIEIRQEMTFERQAFEARMQISNGLTNISLESINVEVVFSDDQGEAVRGSSNPADPDALFFIRIASMEGIDDVTGSGTIAPATTGDIHWLIIPAPVSVEDSPAGAVYFVGARLSYLLGGEEHVTQVTPDFIKVRPLPLLSLDYFLPDEVYGDDPFTLEEEPSIPFSLGVRISNNGHGTAADVKIDSAQPKIIDNKQGLAVDFLIEGSEVNGVAAPDTLLIQFGDIAPETSTIGRWLMSCSLSGRFVEFNAEYSHSNELGGELTSLIEDVRTHFLVQDVLVDAPGRDTFRDFLGRDMDMLKVYESDAGISEVADLSSEARVSRISDIDGVTQYSVEVAPTAGFFYLQFSDPQGGEKIVSEVVRSDGKILRRENGWLSKKRVEKDWFYYANIFDFNSSGSYTFTMIDPALAPQPPVFEEQVNPVQKEGEEVSFIISLVDNSEPEIANFRTLSVSTMAIQAVDTLDSTECDGKTEISAGRLPVGAKLIDRCDGTAILIWTPQEGQAGDYPLTFTASDGEFSTTVRYHLTITDVDNKPTAQFSADISSGEVPLTVFFIDESLSEDGIASWHWDFGDGTTSTEQLPSHIYEDAGLYPVTLMVTEIDGDKDTVVVQDYITAENYIIPIEFGHVAASFEWQTVKLADRYKDPVVVAMLAGDVSSGAYFTRVRAVLPDSFQVRVESSKPATEESPGGKISYVVMEGGLYTLENGSILYAHHLQSSINGSTMNHIFPESFSRVPVVVAAVASDNLSGTVTPAISNITLDGFQLRLQSEDEPDRAHGAERVDCIGWEPGTGFVDGTVFEVGYMDQVYEGWEYYQFTEQFAVAPSFVAVRQDRVDPLAAGLTFRVLDPFGVEAKLRQIFSEYEKTSPALGGFIAISTLSDTVDSDGDGIMDLAERVEYGTHPAMADSDMDGMGDYEELVYWGDDWDEDADGDTLINLLDRDADNDGFRDGLEIVHGFDPADGEIFPASPIMESGRINVTGKWQTVGFIRRYLDPVVVVTITESSGTASYAMIRNIETASFQVRTTAESEEVLSYIVMERCSYRLPDGTLVIAGSAEAAPADDTVIFEFSDDFIVPPVLVATPASANNPEAASVTLHKVENGDFVFSLQADNITDDTSVPERIDFVAWEPSAGFAGEFIFETGYFADIRQQWQGYQFSRPLYGAHTLVAALQETDEDQHRQLLFQNFNWWGIEARFAKSSNNRFKNYGADNSAGFIALSYVDPDLDSDGDGLTDREEIQIYSTDPNLADSDGDGLGDGDEAARWGVEWNGDIDNDGFMNILDIDSDNDGYHDGLEFVHGFDPADPQDLPAGPIMIVGDLFVDGKWQIVSFDELYIDPVVVIVHGEQTSSQEVFRLRNVLSTGFEIRRLAQGDTVSDASAVSYIVMERGIYTLPDGERVIAEHVTINVEEKLEKHEFTAPFENAPVIVASIESGAEFDPVYVDLSKITSSKFLLGLYDFIGHQYLQGPVQVGFIAWEYSAGLMDKLHHE